MSDTECPYCGEETEIVHDMEGYGLEEDELFEQECDKCEKSFAYTTFIHFSYTTRKANCLNGGVHGYKPTNTYPIEFSRWRCSDCGNEIRMSQDEIEDLKKTRGAA